MDNAVDGHPPLRARTARRTFLKFLLAGVAILSLPIDVRVVLKEINEAPLANLMTELFTDFHSGGRLGNYYLANFPAAHGAYSRISALLHLANDAQHAREILARHRQTQFASGEVVIIEGWILARCEADICATLALLA